MQRACLAASAMMSLVACSTADIRPDDGAATDVGARDATTSEDGGLSDHAAPDGAPVDADGEEAGPAPTDAMPTEDAPSSSDAGSVEDAGPPADATPPEDAGSACASACMGVGVDDPENERRASAARLADLGSGAHTMLIGSLHAGCDVDWYVVRIAAPRTPGFPVVTDVTLAAPTGSTAHVQATVEACGSRSCPGSGVTPTMQTEGGTTYFGCDASPATNAHIALSADCDTPYQLWIRIDTVGSAWACGSYILTLTQL